MLELDTNAHSVFLLHYHLILVIKYRRDVINKVISDRAKEIFEYIAPTYKITVQEWNYQKDHVHILFKAHPKSELSKFINAYKSASSRLIKKEFPHLKEKLWGEYFWSTSFCLLTAGGAPLLNLIENSNEQSSLNFQQVQPEIIRKYIESQGAEDE